jgi:Protein of unknown function (DUF3311)
MAESLSDNGEARGPAFGPGRANDVQPQPRSRARFWYLLLLAPFVGLLWVPLYADTDPELFGFPFFYWYQLAWVPVTAALTWIVYKRVD